MRGGVKSIVAHKEEASVFCDERGKKQNKPVHG